MQDRSLIDKLLEEAAWEGKNAFPSTAEWRKDICDLLEFLEKEGQLERHWPALTSERPRQRNAAIAEARVARFLADQGCEIIDWTPEVEIGRTPEFEIMTPGGERVMVEVKAPDWQAELSPEERREGRVFEPKDKQAEVGSDPK